MNIFSRLRSLSPNQRRSLPRLLTRGERILLSLFVLTFITSGTYTAVLLTDKYSVSVPSEGGIYQEGIIGIPRFINPLLAISDADRDLTNLVYTGLLRQNGEGMLISSIADRYEISDDGLEYVFYLRKNARWSDGIPLTADDVLFTMSLVKDPNYRSVLRANWEGVSVEKIDDYSVVFTLAKPYAPFLDNLTMGILPKHIWRDVIAAEFTLSENNLLPIGAGPFRILSFDQHASGRITSFTLEHNRHYLPHVPYIKSIKIMFFTSASELEEAYKKQIVDAASISSLVNTERYTSPFKLSLPRIFGVFFNQNASRVLADHNVRKALEYATNREQLITDILHGHGIAAYTPLPHQFLGSSTSLKQVIPFPFNHATSTSILQDANWIDTDEDGIRDKEIDDERVKLAFTISTSNAPDLVETGRLLQDMWKAVGVEVGLDIYEISDFEQNILRPRKYDAVLFGEVFGYDPDPFAFWHATQRNDPGLNIAMYTNPRADALMEEARTVTDSELRAEIYRKFEEIVLEESPAIFLYSPYYRYQPASKINGIAINHITVPSDRFGNIHTWYIQTKKQWAH